MKAVLIDAVRRVGGDSRPRGVWRAARSRSRSCAPRATRGALAYCDRELPGALLANKGLALVEAKAGIVEVKAGVVEAKAKIEAALGRTKPPHLQIEVQTPVFKDPRFKK